MTITVGFPPDHDYTGHNAPLRGYKDEDNKDHAGYKFNMVDTIQMYLDWGMPIEKMVIGVPTYGRGFQVVNPENNGLYCPADDGIPMGPYTRQKGHYGYLEILQLFNPMNETYQFMPEAESHGWKVTVDPCYHAPYTTNGPYWIGYDDPDSVEYKTKYINFLGAAGVMVWSIETDDHGDFYSDVSYPLLRRINEVLVSGETYDPASDAELCETPPEKWCDIIGSLSAKCHEHMEKLPYPGDCHDYYFCILEDEGDPDDPSDDLYSIDRKSCDAYIYDPISKGCLHPNSSGAANLCARGN